MIKVERYIREYSSAKIKFLEQCRKEYPHQAEDFERMIDQCIKAVWLRERGFVTEDEAVRMILEAR